MAPYDKEWSIAQQQNEFHRVISLHYECVADVLRKLVHQKLDSKRIIFADFLDKCERSLRGRKCVTDDQRAILQSKLSTLQDMDVSLLTMLLLDRDNVASINSKERDHIKALRDHRNELAHNKTGRLTDMGLFKRSCHDICALSQSLSIPVQEEIKTCIDELQQRQFVRKFSTLEVLELNKEQFEVILIESDQRDSEKGKHAQFSQTVLKYNLTKWARQISRGIDLHPLIETLKRSGIISAEDSKTIIKSDNDCEQAPMLIAYFVKEKDRADILALCQEIRASGTPYIADLIEGKNTDGKDAERCIREDIKYKVTVFLRSAISLKPGEYETAENVHIRVEEEINRMVEFSVIDEVMEVAFSCRESDGRFDGVCFSTLVVSEGNPPQAVEENADVASMSLDDYADFVGSKFEFVNKETCHRISSQLKNEFIKMEDFVVLTDDELMELFAPCMDSKRLEFGIKKEFKRIQKLIKQKMNLTKIIAESQLRPFGKSYKHSYEKGEVSYSVSGELHDPAHELMYPPNGKLKRHFVMKTAVKFIAGCINGRKNGTIHFGLKRLNRNKAEVIGVYLDTELLNTIDSVIDVGIQRCFEHIEQTFQRKIRKCIQPAQVIPILDQNEVVVEVDIIPCHLYLSQIPSFYVASFPPNGRQTSHIFFLDCKNNCEVGTIAVDRIIETQDSMEQVVEERKRVDLQYQRNAESARKLSDTLVKELTRGADYITDAFYPIIVAGKVTEKENTHIFDLPGLKDAFQNSIAIFDFNSSTELRMKVEDGTPMFLVKTTDELTREEEDVSITNKDKLWVYCNGNDDKKVCPVLGSQAWVLERMNKVENVLRSIKKKIVSSRAKLIMLVFEEVDRDDPMVEFATAAFTRLFPNTCTIIAASSDDIKTFQNELTSKMGFERVNRCLFHGIEWELICKVFRKIFRENTGDFYKIPNSTGTFDEITGKERETWKDIEILSMEECVQEEKELTPDDIKAKSTEEKKRFYSGHRASWWNFHYGHICERSLFRRFRDIVDNRLTREAGKMLVEWVEIKHYPGAGGSTLGRHLIWHFSQERCTSKPYRCCIVKQLSETTVHEIESFRDFNDMSPRPVVILLDHVPHEHMLEQGLQRLAYKTASPGELFGLVIQVSRVSLLEDTLDDSSDSEFPSNSAIKQILQQQLTRREKVWFENKHRELADEKDANIDVNTLLAFNFMYNDFSPEYMKNTTEEIMKDSKPFEINILKILSVVCNYKTGTLVPECIFDSLVPLESFQRVPGKGKPYGLRRRPLEEQPPEILNSKVVGLFVCRAGYLTSDRGLSIICQPLAQILLEYIKSKSNCHLEDIILDVLRHMEPHAERQDNRESQRFVEIVCSLFKTRVESEKSKDGTRDKFSLLINALLGKEKKDEDKERIIRLMETCFDISEDAFVGQQLARFHIKHTKKYDEAEDAICRSIAIVHDNSFLYDTYGQVFRSNMEYKKESSKKKSHKFSDVVVLEVVDLAFKALDKFIDGQTITRESEKATNMSVYYMEVKTLVGLLETITWSDSFTNDDDLRFILSGSVQDLNRTFLYFMHNNNMLEPILVGGGRQVHAATTLQYLEEHDYQVKKIFSVYIDDDVLLLNLRESFERFYRSHGMQFHLNFGYGLKPLMKSLKKGENTEMIQLRYEHAKSNLESLPLLDSADARDLLFYIGFTFTQMISGDIRLTDDLCRRLLNYTVRLVDLQSELKRPYLEAYLYFAIFHWPAPSRLKFSNLATYNTYRRITEEWDRAFFKNNFVATNEQRKLYKGKNYFALGKNHQSVIDMNEIEIEWRRKKEKEEGRTRMPVYRDFFWREPFVAELLERLTGVLDDDGEVISHDLQYDRKQYNSEIKSFPIKSFYPCHQLKNRKVSFILGFTWSGLRAFDVIEYDKNSQSTNSHLPQTETRAMPDMHNFSGNNNSRNNHALESQRKLFSATSENNALAQHNMSKAYVQQTYERQQKHFQKRERGRGGKSHRGCPKYVPDRGSSSYMQYEDVCNIKKSASNRPEEPPDASVGCTNETEKRKIQMKVDRIGEVGQNFSESDSVDYSAILRTPQTSCVFPPLSSAGTLDQVETGLTTDTQATSNSGSSSYMQYEYGCNIKKSASYRSEKPPDASVGGTHEAGKRQIQTGVDRDDKIGQNISERDRVDYSAILRTAQTSSALPPLPNARTLDQIESAFTTESVEGQKGNRSMYTATPAPYSPRARGACADDTRMSSKQADVKKKRRGQVNKRRWEGGRTENAFPPGSAKSLSEFPPLPTDISARKLGQDDSGDADNMPCHMFSQESEVLDFVRSREYGTKKTLDDYFGPDICPDVDDSWEIAAPNEQTREGTSRAATARGQSYIQECERALSRDDMARAQTYVQERAGTSRAAAARGQSRKSTRQSKLDDLD